MTSSRRWRRRPRRGWFGRCPACLAGSPSSTPSFATRSTRRSAAPVAWRCTPPSARRSTGRPAAALANHRGLFSQMGAVDPDRVAALEAALQGLPPGDSPLRARLLASLATELHFAGEVRRVELGREAVAMARRLGDDATLAETLA